jgi:hypothetical protein
LTGTVQIGVSDPKSDPVLELASAWMVRDRLRSYHSPGLYADASWGMWVGLAGMVLVALSLVLAGTGRRPYPLGPYPGPL